MNKEEYQKLVKDYTPKEKKLENAFMAFVTGGIVGVIGAIIYTILLKFDISSKIANTWTIIILILLASLATSLCFFDNWVNKARCGLIVPITGFAHSVTSSALDYKKDGLITGLGSNIFKLAGSVIIYGVISAYVLTIIGVIFNVKF